MLQKMRHSMERAKQLVEQERTCKAFTVNKEEAKNDKQRNQKGTSKNEPQIYDCIKY